MLLAVVSATAGNIASANPVDGRAIAAKAWAIAVTSALLPSTTIVVRRERSNGAPAPIVSDEGAGMICGPETTGRGAVVGEGTVVQAATNNAGTSRTKRDISALQLVC